jgi:tripartite-type tricarboxylate transporter receptor subunit TctC
LAAGAVKIVVPFAAGATPDIVARLIADRLHNTLDRTFIVENKPGASGNTGSDAVVKAAPDGSTIGVSIGGPLAINTLLFGKLPYDPRKDLTLITQHPQIRVMQQNQGFLRLLPLWGASWGEPGEH